MNDAAAVIGALATLVAGVTGLLKVVRLWQTAQAKDFEARKQAYESDAVQKLEYELATTKRLLHVCEEGIELYQESRFHPERFR